MPTFTTLLVALVCGATATALTVRGVYQWRRPSNRAGRRELLRMNNSHAAVTRWGLSHISVQAESKILDVGCGGGGTIAHLASQVHGKIFGVDYSEVSVATSRQLNKDSIARGSVSIQQASVSQLPFPDQMFDLALAVETHYYWPDLPGDIREVGRVLKQGGKFVVIAETYAGLAGDGLRRWIMTRILRAAYLTPAEHQQLLTDAGYADVRVLTDATKGWICAIAIRA